ncbi:MAG: carboxypeptidase regulatory-like domain-containing protein [Planctomycetes bacterium]|nr:carboxypeptidase regulatory-like domain-containing protein [Planctomycetota bacterium]
MNPKSGKAGSPVSPAEPKPAEDADVADPGEVAKVKADQIEAQKGKYGSTPAKPHKPPKNEEEKKVKNSWIEIELVDEDGQPVPGLKYRVTLPDDSVAEGTLDGKGFARIEGIPAGNCKITFPDLDKDAWEPA